MRFDRVIWIRGVRGKSKIHIGVTLGLQESNGYPPVTKFILIRALGFLAIWNKSGLIFYGVKLHALHNLRVLFHHDGNELIAELDVREAIIDFEPMSSMGSAAFKRLVRAGHLVRFGQEDDFDRLLEQLISAFGFFQRLVRIKTCKPEDDGNDQRSENLGKAFCLFPRIAICHDTPLSVGSTTGVHLAHVIVAGCDWGHNLALFFGRGEAGGRLAPGNDGLAGGEAVPSPAAIRPSPYGLRGSLDRWQGSWRVRPW